MVRLIAIALIVIVVWLAAMQAVRFMKSRTIDWTGIAFMIGFVVLAFYLRQVTGTG